MTIELEIVPVCDLCRQPLDAQERAVAAENKLDEARAAVRAFYSSPNSADGIKALRRLCNVLDVVIERKHDVPENVNIAVDYSDCGYPRSRIVLDDETFDKLVEMIEKPAAPTQALVEAIRRHRPSARRQVKL